MKRISAVGQELPHNVQPVIVVVPFGIETFKDGEERSVAPNVLDIRVGASRQEKLNSISEAVLGRNVEGRLCGVIGQLNFCRAVDQGSDRGQVRLLDGYVERSLARLPLFIDYCLVLDQ